MESLLACAVLWRVPKPPEALFSTFGLRRPGAIPGHPGCDFGAHGLRIWSSSGDVAKSASGGLGTLESTAHASKLSTNRARMQARARFVKSLLACAVLSRVPKPPEALFAIFSIFKGSKKKALLDWPCYL